MEEQEIDLRKLFKKDHPETVGETDQAFDNLNYIDWLEEQTKELKASLEQKDLEYKKLQDSLLDVSRKALEELDNRDKTIQELKGKLEVMSNALKVCHKSLYTYGTHPIIDSQVEKALSQIK